MPMPRFLTQPPPAAIAILNAIIGLVMPLFGTFLLHAFLVSWSENSPDHGPKLLPVSFATCAAVVGLLACAGLAWATPAGVKRVMSHLLVAASFAASALIVVGGFLFPIGGVAAPLLVVVLVISACGAAMAWTMAVAARNFGAKTYLPPFGIAIAGAALAGIWTGISFALDPFLLFFLPALWLAAITFACLVP